MPKAMMERHLAALVARHAGGQRQKDGGEARRIERDQKCGKRVDERFAAGHSFPISSVFRAEPTQVAGTLKGSGGAFAGLNRENRRSSCK
jgi:hypothetical protein